MEARVVFLDRVSVPQRPRSVGLLLLTAAAASLLLLYSAPPPTHPPTDGVQCLMQQMENKRI